MTKNEKLKKVNEAVLALDEIWANSTDLSTKQEDKILDVQTELRELKNLIAYSLKRELIRKTGLI